ncbi:hypothetical protein NMY22_g2681 [Coprinellus aureogranulatus]|nr:hypothetical protein NMY22_g2681 [Coprinellus aureogranulatus]
MKAPPKGRKRPPSLNTIPQTGRSTGYPSFMLYSPVYPHFDLYPAPAGELLLSKGARNREELPVSLARTKGYPFFSLYPPVYPHFDLYPAVLASRREVISALLPGPAVAAPHSVMAAAPNYPTKPWGHSWPYRQPQGPASSSFPHSVSTPSQSQPTQPIRLEVHTKSSRKGAVTESAEPWVHSWPYRRAATPNPALILENKPEGTPPRLWGHNWPYRNPTIMKAPTPSASSSSSVYPYFILYPSVYPHFDLYPQPSGHTAKATSSRPITSTASVVQTLYPSLIIYPAVYPFNLSEIYSGPVQASSTRRKSSRRVVEHPLEALAKYPTLCIYRPVYPYLDTIYPPVAVEPPRPRAECPCANDPLAVFSGYPSLRIYRPTYPHNLENIYPPVKEAVQDPKTRPISYVMELNDYPVFQIYSPVYPHNLRTIYPMPAASVLECIQLEHPGSLPVRFPAHYPHLDLYPAVYPNFCLWPATFTTKIEPPLATDTFRNKTPQPRRPRRRTHAELHALVMGSDPSANAPTLSPPTAHSVSQLAGTRRSGRLTHAELHAMVMMEQRLSKSSLLSDRSESEVSIPSSPLSSSPVKRAVAVRFEVDVPRKLYSPIRSSTLPPLRSEEPRGELPPVPSSSLSRSSTLPLRRPPPSTQAYPGGRSTVYDPENMRARGLGNNTMSKVSLERRGSTVARRMTLWENGGPVKSPNGPPTPSIRHTAKNRDSIVMQRIKAFNSS